MNLKGIDSNGAKTTLSDYIAAGDSFTFVCYSYDFVKIEAYFVGGGGSATIAPVDDGIFNELTDVSSNVSSLSGVVSCLDPITNIANPADKISDSVWVSSANTYSASGWSRMPAIAVEPETTYTASELSTDFSWFTNANNENLGKITTNPFTTPSGCTAIKVSESGSDNFVIVKGTRTAPLVYADYPYNVTKTKIDSLETDVSELQNTVNAIPLTSISMFATVGAIGDSYTSGGIYGVTGLDGSAYYKVSWPQILARKCGFEATNFSASGLDVSGWLLDSEYGLAAIQSAPAQDLYVITLGINGEKTLADQTVSAQIGTVEDIDISDPSQNADTFCGHYGKMLSAIIAHAPDAKIILVQPLLTSAEKLTAIANIATLFSVPYFRMSHDSYYSTDFYNDNLHTSHPIALTYAGMALAFERQITKCMIDNVSYFTNCH